MSRSFLIRNILTLLLTLGYVPSAFAELKVATVDFQRALSEVNEGVAAMARLEGIRDEKMKALKKKEAALASMQNELQNQAAILSDAARREKEEAFYAAQAELQRAVYTSEQEFQQTFQSVLSDLMTKMKETAEALGREKGYNLILSYSSKVDETGLLFVVYASGVPDLTDELIKRYNAAHPGK